MQILILSVNDEPDEPPRALPPPVCCCRGRYSIGGVLVESSDPACRLHSGTRIHALPSVEYPTPPEARKWHGRER